MFITKKWIMVVPRKEERAVGGKISLNSLGILGGILITEDKGNEIF